MKMFNFPSKNKWKKKKKSLSAHHLLPFPKSSSVSIQNSYGVSFSLPCCHVRSTQLRMRHRAHMASHSLNSGHQRHMRHIFHSQHTEQGCMCTKCWPKSEIQRWKGREGRTTSNLLLNSLQIGKQPMFTKQTVFYNSVMSSLVMG